MKLTRANRTMSARFFFRRHRPSAALELLDTNWTAEM